jgi:hypothetical protein
MSTYNTSFSFRRQLERAIAGVIFGGATALIASGTFALCFQGTPLVA